VTESKVIEQPDQMPRAAVVADLGRNGGIGVAEAMALKDGIGVVLHRYRLSRDFSHTVHGHDLLRFRVQLSGRRVLTFQNRHKVEITGASTLIFMHDAGVSKLEHFVAGADEHAVSISLERSRLREYFDEEHANVPSGLRYFIGTHSSQPRMAMTPPALEERTVAAALINCPRTGALRRIYIEAKVMELFCLVLDRFSPPSSVTTVGARISQRDRRQLAEVRDFLRCEFTAPPTMHTLARRFGMNRNKLCTGFRVLFGLTIYDYCSTLRLEKARELLCSDLTLTEIAHFVGYGSLGAFSTAFNRQFGSSPSSLRGRPYVINSEAPANSDS
jgi:AraC family transcriptional activator of pyochelin receptor